MEKHDKIKKISDNGLKIYPVIRNRKFAVCIEDGYNIIYKNKKTVGIYKHTTATINKAIDEAIDFCYMRIINTYENDNI